MPNFDIVKIVNPKKTFRVASVMGRFDLQTNQVKEQFIGNLDLSENWQIGLIVGKSGTGKTTIAKQLFPDAYVTNFEYSAETILNEKDFFVFDEFTSVVDRQVAKIGSFAMQKAIRKTQKKFIAVTCHEDVEDWLLPDWVFNTNDMTFHENENQKKNRPDLRFEVFETKEKQHYWRMFGKYHYLSHSHNKSARVFIASVDDEVCGFYSVLHLPNKKPNIKIGHRLVVLPEYQGLNIGLRLSNTVAELILKEGYRFVAVTSSPALIESRKKNPNWVCTNYGRKGRQSNFGGLASSDSSKRLTTSWEYISNV